MTPRRRRRVEVVRLARRPLACPIAEPEPEPVEVVVPAPAVLVRRRSVWGTYSAAELRHAVEGEFREGSRCR